MNNEIEELQKILTSAHAQADLKNIAVIVPASYKIEDTEKYYFTPKRFRAAYKTDSFDSFIAYIKQHASENTVISVNKEKMTATAILDQGDIANPLWGDHTATLTLKRTPEFNAIMKLNGNNDGAFRLSRDVFVDFIDDYNPFLQFRGRDENGDWIDIPVSVAFTRFKKITINHSVIAHAEQNAASKSGQISTSTCYTSAGESFPAEFGFCCNPFDSFDERSLLGKIRIVEEKGEIFFSIRLGPIESVLEMIAKEFAEKINACTAEFVHGQIYIGTIDYQHK